jgi:hypothetical protein
VLSIIKKTMLLLFQIRLSRWSSTCNGQKQGSEAGHLINILQEHALAATNCPDLQSACALLELAANAGALSLLVCANPYRQGRDQLKSMLYAYPLVNTQELLRSIPVCAICTLIVNSLECLLLRPDCMLCV